MKLYRYTGVMVLFISIPTLAQPDTGQVVLPADSIELLPGADSLSPGDRIEQGRKTDSVPEPAYSTPRDSVIQYYSRESQNLMDAIVVDGDTIPIMTLDEVLFVDKPSFNSQVAKNRYFILRKRVLKVYPYAVMAGNKLDSLNLILGDIKSKRRKKRFIKDFQAYLENRFEQELKQLTRSEGQILSKLIFRETQMSTYELIKEYRSGWNAFWWNSAAFFYDIDLKTPYDPVEVEEDKLIENILKRAFIQGMLEEREPITEL